MANTRIIGVALAAALALATPNVVRADTLDTVAPALQVDLSSPLVSPNGDGRLDRVMIRVTVDEPATVTVRVRNPGGIGSATLADHLAVLAGTTPFVWNGRLRRPNGTWARAADGRITIDVAADDLAANESSDHEQPRVDTEAPLVDEEGVTPEPWTGHGLFTQRFSTHDPSGPLTMWSQVLHRGRVVDEMVHHERPADTHELAWVPEAGDQPLTPGPYQAVVVVRDAAGNTGRSRAAPFRVHRAGSTYVIRQVEHAGHRVGLTIDDCTDRDAWSSMLDTLRRLGAGATFFCNGRYVRAYPDVARTAVATPRVSVGSHTTDHADLTTLGYGDVLVRLLGDESAWWDVARTTPAPWFRPPYGAYDPTVLAAAGAASLPFTVLWSIDTEDYRAPDAATIVHRATDKAKPGSIILIHVKALTAQALPSIIATLRARGLEPVGLPELTGRG